MAARAKVTTALGVATFVLSALVILGGYVDVAAYKAGFIPARFLIEEPLPGAVPALLTPFTSALLHGGWFHLITNMVLLVFLGLRIEPVFGARGVLIAYLAGAVLASGAQFLAEPESLNPMIGASGAISAWFAMNALIFGQQSRLTRSPWLNRWITAAWLLAAWIVLQYLVEALFLEEGILLATPAHIGGFVAGLLLQRPLLKWRVGRAIAPEV